MSTGAAVPQLVIDLQDGFSGDEVIVRVNGQEVERRSDVRTKRNLGLAQTIAIQVPDGPVTVQVDVPTKGVNGHTEVRHPQLGVSLAGKEIQFVQSDDEFGYG
jgi:hypothetical protein